MNHANTILIVDDEQVGRKTLEGMLRFQGYELVFAESGPEALTLAQMYMPDIILLDVMMPGMDGFEVCRRLRASEQLAEVPIIMVTMLDDRGSRLRGIEAGADDFVSKPLDRVEFRARIRTITRLNRYRRLLAERAKFERVIELSPDGMMIVDTAGMIRLANTAILTMLGGKHKAEVLGTALYTFVAPDERYRCAECLRSVFSALVPTARLETVFVRADGQEFPVGLTAGHFIWDGETTAQLIIRDITERKRTEEQIQRSHVELAQAYDTTLEGWSRALDLRDKETEGHSQRVTELTMQLAGAMGISEADQVHIRRGALLHDIGKMGIPDGILLKPGPLTDEEWVVMRRHPTYAWELLSPIEFLRPALDIPHYHHEKWDGSGYPFGLSGKQIPIAARIFAVIDVWDALCSDRPYRRGWTKDRAREHIRGLAGSHFDPQVVEVFLQLESEQQWND